MLFPRRLAFSLAFALAALPALADAPPKVLASIKPLQSLAENVMDGIGRPALLMRAAASPHTYTLRPSEARAIEQADILFWIGPDYESFMAKAVGGMPRKARVVAMNKAEGITLLASREGGVWAADDHHHHGDQSPDAVPGGQDGEHDMHLWLDPTNAKAIAAAMAKTLAEADPANAAAYRANAAKLAGRLDGLDEALRARLAPVAHKPYIVFHDAYQYLERRYGLTAAGSITVTPDRVPGARRLSELRRTVTERKAACIFREPQFTSALVATVTNGTRARIGVLDPLGTAIPDGKDAYFQTMHSLADSLATCLANPA